MQLTNDVLSLLKSFSDFNTNIKFVAGDPAMGKTEIRACNPSKTFLARAEVDIVLPRDFCLYDLKEFLNTVSLFEEPEFEFFDSHLIINDSQNRSCRYFYSDPELVAEYTPDYTKSLDMPYDFSFNLSEDNLTRITRAASIMGLETITIRNKGEGLEIVAVDEGDETAHTFGVMVAELFDGDANVFLARDDVCLINADYKVDVNATATHFKHKEMSLEYWIVNQASKG